MSYVFDALIGILARVAELTVKNVSSVAPPNSYAEGFAGNSCSQRRKDLLVKAKRVKPSCTGP
jgi:hypothetical protein